MSHTLEVHSVTGSLLSHLQVSQIERVWKFYILLQKTTLIFEIVKIKNINTYEILTNPNNVPQTLNRHETFEDAFKQVYYDLKNIDEIALHLPPLTPDLLKQCKMNQSFHIKDTGERRDNQTHEEME